MTAYTFTNRQRQVLALLKQGARIRDIAAALQVDPQCVQDRIQEVDRRYVTGIKGPSATARVLVWLYVTDFRDAA